MQHYSLAPNFSLVRVRSSQQISLSAFRGNWVVLVFWAQWCGPCNKEQPSLTRLSMALRPFGIKFLGIDDNDNRAAAAAFLNLYKVPYYNVYDPSGELLALYNVPFIPYFVFISPKGYIVGRYAGAIGAKRMIGYLRKLGAIKNGVEIKYAY